MNKNQAIINIETTGINPHKNHIYLINIYTNQKHYNFYSINNESENKIITSIYKILHDKKIICFSDFDIKFINTKIVKYTDFKVFKDYLSLQRMIQNYCNNNLQSTKSKYLAEELFNIKLDDKSKSVSKYKICTKKSIISDELIEYSKISMNFNIKLYNYLKQYFAHNSNEFVLYKKKIKYLIYNFKQEKNNIIINLLSDNKLAIDAIFDSTEIKSSGMYIELIVSLHEGYIEDDFVECVMTAMTNDYDLVNNYYPLIINHKINYDNIKNYVNYIITGLENEQ
ncbi:ribonuclease H-like domain-containing protein [uncultured Finegoldia sp.]|uniref:ribonuclease H-like domain-containing protein n=1 Tax=uncultured Finegoldia sp. TaxID=328009 RepID=UPI002627CCC4|nr:ribonuclease H-like domain-containing protein [uncultured Finegoldia sp.]